MFPRFSVLFSIFILINGFSTDVALPTSDANNESLGDSAAIIPSTSPDDKEVKEVKVEKGEKLEQEIDIIGKVMQPETIVIQEEVPVKINDEINLKKSQKLEDLTVVKFEMSSQSTEKPAIVDGESAVSNEGIEPVEQAVESQPIETEVEEEEEEPEDTEVVETKEDEIRTTMKPETEEETEKEELNGTSTSIVTTEVSRTTTETEIVKAEVAETTKKEENGRITWDLIHFLLLLSPYDESEVSWWTIVLEAVKCSLRNCPNHNSYWLHHPVYLPRITRHRRQDEDFGTLPSTPKPCPCQNVEKYIEELYEKLSRNTSEKKSTV